MNFRILLLVSLAACGFISSRLGAADSPAHRVEENFIAARTRFNVEKTNSVAAWQFGRAAFDWAEFAKTDTQREQIAKQAIDACRDAIALQPGSGPGHYYLALNLGQLARTRKLSALGIIDEMEQELKLAIQLDRSFDYAGPDRSLGILYMETPGWPVSIGNRGKARVHLEKSVQLAPEFPENRICLAEAYLKWGDKAGFRREVNALKQLWPKAEKEFLGVEWLEEWADWTERWERLKNFFAARKN